MSQEGANRIGVVGAGTIATGLAADLSRIGHVRLVARSIASAERAAKAVSKLAERDPAIEPDRITYGLDAAALADCTLVVEAIAEDIHLKSRLLASLGTVIGPDALLATTTSSLSTEELATLSAVPERFFALHVFNPVTKMQLVELCFPQQANGATREQAHTLCEQLGKTAVEVPDIAGFVVNRLLFPYLFSAVELLEQTELSPADIDTCMKFGVAHPVGPLALLDLVGLDIAVAIGEAIGQHAPGRIKLLVAEGALGRKSGRGFYEY